MLQYTKQQCKFFSLFYFCYRFIFDFEGFFSSINGLKTFSRPFPTYLALNQISTTGFINYI